MNVLETCRLCCQQRELRVSHVWPKFAYKRYVSDLQQGGTFLDLHKEQRTNRQYTCPWFCHDCEQTLSRFETEASKFCAALDEQRSGVHAYGDWLLPFVTSITWRTAMLDAELGRVAGVGKLGDAIKRWRRFLFGRESHVGSFTQHVFVVYPADCEMHRGLGGQVFPNQGLVLSQVGPLNVVGLYDRKSLEVPDLNTWGTSQVHPEGGEVKPVDVWHVGHGGNITTEFAHLLSRHEWQMKTKIVTVFGPSGPQARRRRDGR